MSKHKNSYIKYKRAELEEYIRHPESCIKKIRTTEALKFAPNIIANFTESIMRILSKKIGKHDVKLNGVVLDFRKTKVLDASSLVRNDSTSMLINIESDFYVFCPREGAIVNGIVKYINQQSMETIISVVIYRVFNVKVAFKGNIKQKDIHQDQEIKIRIKNFNFDNVIPFIEGEMISMPHGRKKINFDDAVDSGISESSISVNSLDIVIKKERMDVENGEPINSFDSGRRKRKRKDSSESTQPAKRIKQEVIIDEVVLPTIKQERISDSEEEIAKTPKIKEKEKTSVEEASTSQKKKKKKKKSSMNDFESSLLKLFGTPNVNFKEEKD